MASDERTVPGLVGCLGVPVLVDGVRACLAKLDLHIVTAAEKHVLEAMGKARIVFDPHHKRPIFEFSEDELAVCETELARREANR